MPLARRRPQELVQQLQLWDLTQFSLELCQQSAHTAADFWFFLFCFVFFFFPFLHFSIFLLRALNIKKKNHLINISIFDSFIAAGLDGLFPFLSVSGATCFVVFAMPILFGPLCREDARSGVCHIRCVRMPIGYPSLTRAVPANQLLVSWPFRCRPDPDGRWSVWLVAASTGTVGVGGGGRNAPGRRVRGFLGQSLLFPSSFLLSAQLWVDSWQPFLAGLFHVSHVKTFVSRYKVRSRSV